APVRETRGRAVDEGAEGGIRRSRWVEGRHRGTRHRGDGRQPAGWLARVTLPGGLDGEGERGVAVVLEVLEGKANVAGLVEMEDGAVGCGAVDVPALDEGLVVG